MTHDTAWDDRPVTAAEFVRDFAAGAALIALWISSAWVLLA